MAYNYKYYKNTSRFFRNTSVAEFEFGMALPLLMNKIKFSIADIAIYYTVPANYEGRIDLISYALYATPDLYWAICIANNIDNLIGYPKAGEVLSIPSLNAVRRYI